jgi:hypothetical protein
MLPGVSTLPCAFAWSHRSGARSCDERAPGVKFGEPRLNISVSAVGRAWRTIACFPGVVGSLGEDGGQYAAGAGREVEERGEPAGWAGAAVGQLGNRSCGPARIITGFLPAGGFLQQAKRLPVAGSRARGMWELAAARPGRMATSESASLRLAGVQPRLATSQAPARSAAPATNETAARTR